MTEEGHLGVVDSLANKKLAFLNPEFQCVFFAEVWATDPPPPIVLLKWFVTGRLCQVR